MLLVGMLLAALVFGWALQDYSEKRLIQVIQGAAVVTILLNLVAAWQQEKRDPEKTRHDRRRTSFRASFARFRQNRRSMRLLATVGVGTAGFSMQDILLEPYGGEMLGMSVGNTTALTALLAAGTLLGIWFAARRLGKGAEIHRSAAIGLLAGVIGFAAIIFADPLASTVLFCLGIGTVGFGGGLFAVGTLTAAMHETHSDAAGLALGAWGATQAAAAGIGVALGGAIRDGVGALATSGALGPALTSDAVGYSVVYHLEIFLLFAALVAIGPLVRYGAKQPSRFGLADLPG
jgi:BCD family chlorophyll transporter-like MFS transporter